MASDKFGAGSPNCSSEENVFPHGAEKTQILPSGAKTLDGLDHAGAEAPAP